VCDFRGTLKKTRSTLKKSPTAWIGCLIGPSKEQDYIIEYFEEVRTNAFVGCWKYSMTDGGGRWMGEIDKEDILTSINWVECKKKKLCGFHIGQTEWREIQG
jgi:hypothetical protein